MVLAVGTVIAGYRIEEVLGAGGMGTVYRAAHPSLPRSDALKVLSAELSLNPQFRARFQREADLAATLDHPNIVAVYNRGETEDGLLWIAMQYVAGSDAGKELQSGRMTPQRALHIVSEVGKALDYAHRRSVMHRDVKPANFLLADGDERVFLADFGIARAVDDAANLTDTGMVMGSMAYSPPEMLNGRPLDGRADIYSLGCSLYKLLTGRAPFGEGAGMVAMATGHMMTPPPRATAVAPWLPPAIDPVIIRSMAKDPAQRQATAGEFVNAATAALRDGQTTTPVSGGSGDTREWRTPPPVPPPAFRDPSSYPSGPFAGPRPPGPPPGHHPNQPPAHPPPGPRAPGPTPSPARRGLRHRWVLAAGAIVMVVVITAGIAAAFLLSGDDAPAYQAQSLRHTYGTTELTARPRAVAALGPGDADAVLSLGVQPVVLGALDGRLPGYEQRAVTGSPKVVTFTDTGAVAGARPDVVVDTGDIDQATYDKLAALAPTVTLPAGQPGWNWQEQLKWVGRILGYESTAQDLINKVRTQLDDLKNQHANFTGKSIEVVTVADSGVTQTLTPSRAADYLEALGFRYNDELSRKPTDTGSSRPLSDLDKIYLIETDVLIVIRTDKAAGSGGYDGLPRQFSAYKGAMVIVDQPDMITALSDPGGYLATEFLNDSLVNAIARQVR